MAYYKQTCKEKGLNIKELRSHTPTHHLNPTSHILKKGSSVKDREIDKRYHYDLMLKACTRFKIHLCVIAVILCVCVNVLIGSELMDGQ